MRLSALSGTGQSLSRQEHDSITEIKLVRRRTLAAQKSESQPLSPPWDGTSFPTAGGAQSASHNRNGNMVLEKIRKNSLAPPVYDPPQSNQAFLPSSGESPPRPQVKRYALSDGPPTGPVRATSPARKLRKFQEQRNSSSTSLANNTSERFVAGPGRAPSPGWSSRRQSTADDVDPLPTSSAPIVPPSINDNSANATTSAPSKHPTTFAEMGFTGVKADDKDCIIM